jgi:enhancing lycopene biosynthesis protein 2
LLKDMHQQKKPIGALCIAPALIARLFGKEFPSNSPWDGFGPLRPWKMGAKHKMRSKRNCSG